MLQACHEQIERQLSTLERLVERVATGCDADARSAAESVLRYFDTSGALHHEDEDRDLFPLLHAEAAKQGRAEISAVVDELVREHGTMDRQWQRLRQQLQSVAGGGGRLDAEEISRFVWLYRSHMSRETAALMPFAKQALNAAQRSALGARMAARRKVEFGR